MSDDSQTLLSFSQMYLLASHKWRNHTRRFVTKGRGAVFTSQNHLVFGKNFGVLSLSLATKACITPYLLGGPI
jgi:hypothetical protein